MKEGGRGRWRKNEEEEWIETMENCIVTQSRLLIKQWLFGFNREFTINAFQNTGKIILVSHTRPLFRSTKVNYFIGQLWELLTASNVGAGTQAWQAKWAVFKIPGFVCKRFLHFFATLSRLFYLLHFSHGLTLVLRSLLLNRAETLATQATGKDTDLWSLN